MTGLAFEMRVFQSFVMTIKHIFLKDKVDGLTLFSSFKSLQIKKASYEAFDSKQKQFYDMDPEDQFRILPKDYPVVWNNNSRNDVSIRMPGNGLLIGFFFRFFVFLLLPEGDNRVRYIGTKREFKSDRIYQTLLQKTLQMMNMTTTEWIKCEHYAILGHLHTHEHQLHRQSSAQLLNLEITLHIFYRVLTFRLQKLVAKEGSKKNSTTAETLSKLINGEIQRLTKFSNKDSCLKIAEIFKVCVYVAGDVIPNDTLISHIFARDFRFNLVEGAQFMVFLTSDQKFQKSRFWIKENKMCSYLCSECIHFNQHDSDKNELCWNRPINCKSVSFKRMKSDNYVFVLWHYEPEKTANPRLSFSLTQPVLLTFELPKAIFQCDRDSLLNLYTDGIKTIGNILTSQLLADDGMSLDEIIEFSNPAHLEDNHLDSNICSNYDKVSFRKLLSY